MGNKAATAVPFLARALSDADPTVRAAAAAALARMGPAAGDVVDDILAARTDNEPAVRIAVLETLVAVGRKKGVADAMFAALADPDPGVRAAACKALQGLKPPPGKDDIFQFNTALKSDKVDVRRFAATELERLGADAAGILPAIVDAMKDPDPQVAKSVYTVIGAIGPPAKTAAPTLLEAMDRALADAGKDAEAAERFRRASVALGRIGQADRALPIMRPALKGKDEALKKEVLIAFAAMGPDAKDVVPDLCVMLEDAKWRRPAAETLAKIGKPAVDPLLVVLDKKSKEIKLAALDALARMKPEDAKDAIGDLARAVRTYPNEVGEAARLVLDKIQKGLPKKK
jgi:HEAT repeat protein